MVLFPHSTTELSSKNKHTQATSIRVDAVHSPLPASFAEGTCIRLCEDYLCARVARSVSIEEMDAPKTFLKTSSSDLATPDPPRHPRNKMSYNIAASKVDMVPIMNGSLRFKAFNRGRFSRSYFVSVSVTSIPTICLHLDLNPYRERNSIGAIAVGYPSWYCRNSSCVKTSVPTTEVPLINDRNSFDNINDSTTSRNRSKTSQTTVHGIHEIIFCVPSGEVIDNWYGKHSIDNNGSGTEGSVYCGEFGNMTGNSEQC
jgi:hypothetical protein